MQQSFPGPLLVIAPAFEPCASFLRSIGIEVEVVPGVSGFLRDIRIECGCILVDPVHNSVCGSMLHEGGHIAITPSVFRPLMTGDATESIGPAMDRYIEEHPTLGFEEDPIVRGIVQAGDPEASAWSYAAAIAAGVDTMLPFQGFFDDQGEEIHDMIAAGRYLGINGLRAAGMIETRGPNAFPKMLRWMQI